MNPTMKMSCHPEICWRERANGRYIRANGLAATGMGPTAAILETGGGLNAMLTLNDIEKAVDGLTVDEKRELHRYLEETLHDSGVTYTPGRSHSILDIAPVQLGSVLQPGTEDEDILDEMLVGRQ